jgi:hypothetical protein
MGSHPTLDHTELAAEALELDPGGWRYSHAVAHLAAEHPQVRDWPDDSPELAHQLDHRDWIYDHPHPTSQRTIEEAFDRLNPEFGLFCRIRGSVTLGRVAVGTGRRAPAWPG